MSCATCPRATRGRQRFCAGCARVRIQASGQRYRESKRKKRRYKPFHGWVEVQ